MSNVIILYGLWALSLVVMKLAEVGAVASWSWWAVLAPLWAPLALVVVLALPFYMAHAVRKQWGRR